MRGIPQNVVTVRPEVVGGTSKGITNMVNLYNMLELLCDRSGISLEELFKKTRIDRSYIPELESGRQTFLPAKDVKKLCNYFGVSASFLYGYDELAKKEHQQFEKAREPERLAEKTDAESEIKSLVGPLTTKKLEDALKARPELALLLMEATKMSKQQVVQLVRFLKTYK